MKPPLALRHFLLGSTLLAAVSTANGQTWDGSTDGSWNSGANWSGNAVPGASAAIIFDGTGINLNTTTNAPFTLNSLTFTSGQTSAVTINTTAGALDQSTGTGLRFNPGTVLSVQAGDHRIVGTGVNSGIDRDVVFNGTASTNSYTFDIGTGASFNIQGRIGATGTGSNTRTYNKTGGGTLILSTSNGGTNSWQTGGFTISAGAVRFAASAAAGNTANSYSVSNGAALELSGGVTLGLNNGNFSLNGTGIGSTGALRSLSGNNTISGTGTGGIVLASASSIGVDANRLTINQVVSGAFALTKVGSGTLVLGGSTASAANTYSGGTTISAGTLQFSKTIGMSATGAVAVQDTTTLAVNAGGAGEFSNATSGNGSIGGMLSGLGGQAGGTVNYTGNVKFGIDTTNAGGSLTYSGVIGNVGTTLGLTKLGTGTLVLDQTNTYSGATTVTTGTLAVNGSLANTSGVTVQTGATLQGSGSISSSVTINGGGFLAAGNSIDSLATGALSFANGSTYAYELQTNLYGTTPEVSGDLTYSSGTLDIIAGSILTLTDLAASTALPNGSKLTLISYSSGWTGTELFSYNAGSGLTTLADNSTFILGDNQWFFDYNDTSGGFNYTTDQLGAGSFVTMTAIPEPGSALLGGIGLLFLLRRRRN